MLAEVKKCADRRDIKGLRYIFVDCLDVDPTFEKYKVDYEYCKKIPGMFDAHQELNELVENEKLWDKDMSQSWISFLLLSQKPILMKIFKTFTFLKFQS